MSSLYSTWQTPVSKFSSHIRKGQLYLPLSSVIPQGLQFLYGFVSPVVPGTLNWELFVFLVFVIPETFGVYS